MPSLSVLNQQSLNVIDQFEFCRLHNAETHIVPEGIKKNYPISIDFDCLPKRVEKLIPELMLVIKGKCKSLYREFALNAYQEFGRARARKPTILMGRFQKFQVKVPHRNFLLRHLIICYHNTFSPGIMDLKVHL